MSKRRVPLIIPSRKLKKQSDIPETKVDIIEDNTAVKRGKSLFENFKEGDFDTLTSGRITYL